MDIISFNEAATANSRIEICNANPDSSSGIVTVPKVIASGETVTIPAGRVAVLPNVQIDGVLNVEGEVFIPSGATLGDLDAQLALKAPLVSPAFTGPVGAKDVSYKSTPVTITSWSYATTTITLNVASHTFVAGDYIEVAGLTATTYPANGIHLITSVTSTTIVFTLSATPTGTTGTTSATVMGYVTINGKVLFSNESIQDFVGSKLANTTYYNTSGKIKFIYIKGSVTIANNTIYMKVNGNGVSMYQAYINNATGFVSAAIPSGASYLVEMTGTINNWVETI